MTKIDDQLAILSRLDRFSKRFSLISSLEELAASVEEVLDDLLEIESSGLYLYDLQEKRLKLLVAKGFTREERAEADKTAMERHPGYVFRTGEVLHIPDTENDPGDISKSSNRSFIVRSRLYMPVFNGVEPVGAFGIVSSQKNRFNEKYQVILSFICNFAGAIYANLLINAEQKKAHDRLAATTIRLETLIKNLQAGILVEDQDRRIALINKSFCRMFGIPVEPDLLMGSDCSDSAEQSKPLFTNPVSFVKRIELILKEKKPVTGEELELVDGRIFERDYIPIFLQGKFLGNLWQYRDITTRVLSAKDLQKATAEAQSANTAKRTFLANMSHEIRTPLNAVIGLSRLMRDTRMTPKQKDLNDKLLTSGETLLGIINEILDFSKIEAGKVDIEAIPFDLNGLLDRVCRFLSPLAEEKTITLSVQSDMETSLAVIGDPARLQQVLVNLVNNAIKFTADGSVTLTCSRVREGDGKVALLFAVTDTGIGISDENLENIFEKFKQEDESITRIYGGTGLGLAISRQLVSLMGGDLAVESKKGKGSRFFFTLELDMADADLLIGTNRKIFIEPDVLKGKNVLVAEDNTFNQFIAKSILEKWNINVDTASNGQEVIDLVRTKTFDLILMDMQMPVMDGFTATEIIRREILLQIPVIALTAFATKEAVDKAMKSGMSGYITKPFEEETLYSQLLTAFGIKPHYISENIPDPKPLIPKADAKGVLYDLSKLNDLFDNDVNEIIESIRQFVEVTPEDATTLFLAYDQGNMDAVAKAAHKMKGSLELFVSGNFLSTIRLIHEYARDNENPGKLHKLIAYLKVHLPILFLQLKEKAEALKEN